MTDKLNPYEAPQLDPADDRPLKTAAVVRTISGAEAIRLNHLRRERSVQAIGQMYTVTGVVALLFSLGTFGTTISNHAEPMLPRVLFALGLLIFAAGCIVVGRGLYKFYSWARPAMLVCAAVFLAISVVFTIYVSVFVVLLGFNLVTLLLLSGRKGRMLFSAEYAKIRAQTPHIQYGKWEFRQSL